MLNHRNCTDGIMLSRYATVRYLSAAVISEFASGLSLSVCLPARPPTQSKVLNENWWPD